MSIVLHAHVGDNNAPRYAVASVDLAVGILHFTRSRAYAIVEAKCLPQSKPDGARSEDRSRRVTSWLAYRSYQQERLFLEKGGVSFCFLF